VTGWGSDDDKARSQEAGFDLHLTKPVDAREVEALLNGLFRTSPAGNIRSAV
jgi:DNA-binding response OmpR family regulator